MGDRDLRVPRFNAQDCHKDIYLSCGRHCASKVGAGMYRSVRASVPLQKSRFVYFEMTLQEGRSPLRGTNQSANKLDVPVRAGAAALKAGGATTATGASETRAGADASVCIGLSTRLTPLNTLVGTSPNSIGFYSAGHVLVGSGPRSSVGVGQKYGYQSTVGVLAQVVDRQDNGEGAGASSGNAPPLSSSTSSGAAPGSSIGEAFVRFTVDGTALRDSENRVMEFSLPFPSRSELYPTLTLHSQDVQVFSRFSAPDVVGLNLQELELPVEEPVEIWCLDGLRLGISA
ncbi:hypothetical protein BBJ28_00021081 [Nothophytophthora sp. Chile5]|nr:hypothetical protein BBJ28_00021081 [Nothophytophthora sp. Chile5]